jgi:hypothetical protein
MGAVSLIYLSKIEIFSERDSKSLSTQSQTSNNLTHKDVMVMVCDCFHLDSKKYLDESVCGLVATVVHNLG